MAKKIRQKCLINKSKNDWINKTTPNINIPHLFQKSEHKTPSSVEALRDTNKNVRWVLFSEA